MFEKYTVTILEKPIGQIWSRAEVNAIVNAMAEVEQLPAMPNRIVVMNKPLRGTIETALGHSDYTSREVDYRNAWV